MKSRLPVRRPEAANTFPLFPQEARYRVISLSRSLDLLWAREAVLRSAGFQVFSAMNPRQVLAKIHAGNFGLLLLCYSLPGRLQREIASEFRKHCPNGRIVAITDSNSSRPPDTDAVVGSADGHNALIDALLGNTLPTAA
jgi:PleD family two-component response regulator